MRISDWSSDVCSSDLVSHRQALKERRREAASGHVARALSYFTDGTEFELWMHEAFETLVRADFSQSKERAAIASARLRDSKGVSAVSDPVKFKIGRASWRESVSDRVDLGGRRSMKNKNI